MATTDFKRTDVPNDADIGRAIQHRFAVDPAIPRGVQFSVRNGFVTLMGEVDWPFEVEEATEVARVVRGVRGISNHIRFKRTLKSHL